MMAIIIASVVGFYTHNNTDSRVEFLSKAIPVAKIVCTVENIPYQVCVTQASLETGYGKIVPYNNYFGVKRIENGKYGYAKYNSGISSLLGYTSAINKHYGFAVNNYRRLPVKFLIWTWGTGYASAENYVPMSVSVMHGIYKRTGDVGFNVRLTSEEYSVIQKLRKAKYGIQRRELTVRLLGDSKHEYL